MSLNLIDQRSVEGLPQALAERPTQAVSDLRYLRVLSRGYYQLETDFGDPLPGQDYTVQWDEMLQACILDGKQGYLPPIDINIAAPVSKAFTAPFQTLEIIGRGAGTHLNFRGELGAGLTVQYQTIFNAVRMRDFTIQTDSESSALSAFRLLGVPHGDPASGEPNIFERLMFKGVDGYKTAKHFGNCVYTHTINNLFVDKVRAIGPGTAINGGNGKGTLFELQSSPGDYACVQTFRDCYLSMFDQAILMGNYVQGLVMDNVQCVGGSTGLLVPAGQIANDGITIHKSHFNTKDVGVSILAQAATSIELDSNFYIIDKINQVGVRIAAYRWSIMKQHFEGQGTKAGTCGIHAISGAKEGTISNNQYAELSVANLLEGGNPGTSKIIVTPDQVFGTPMGSRTINNGTGNTVPAGF